jgi:signal transduction histidine kinase
MEDLAPTSMVCGNGDHSMYDLTHFRLEDMVACGSALRSLAADASHMEPVANAVVRYLYDHLRAGGDGTRACALVRLYKTHVYADLEPNLRQIVCSGLGDRPPSPAMKCLTLLATAGDQEEWNSRQSSVGHRAIPLYSQEQVDHIPMVAQLIRQFGLESASVLAPDPAIMLDLEQRTYNVFHVLHARGSPYIPAQDEFVIPFGVRSVLGFGGVLPSGDLFAVILFAKVPIPAGTAEFFKTIALNIKVALLPHDATAVFAPREAGASPPGRLAESRSAALAQLLDVQEQTALAQTLRLHAKNDELEIALRQLRETQVLRRNEMEMRRLNAELERRVARRTAELEAANEELEAFSYSVAHDLRAPLRAIEGFSRILLDKYPARLDDTGKDYLRRVGAAAKRLEQLIGDLLNLSRLTRSEMRHMTVDLSALAEEVAAELRQREPQRPVEFVIARGVVAGGDTRLLRFALDNLLGNAWKYTSACGEARIEFGAAPINGQTTYFVRDNGAGFDMAYVEKLFRPFQRLHSEREFPGTGIGLASVKRVVGRHGGRVWAEGAVGRGATFYFTL